MPTNNIGPVLGFIPGVIQALLLEDEVKVEGGDWFSATSWSPGGLTKTKKYDLGGKDFWRVFFLFFFCECFVFCWKTFSENMFVFFSHRPWKTSIQTRALLLFVGLWYGNSGWCHKKQLDCLQGHATKLMPRQKKWIWRWISYCHVSLAESQCSKTVKGFLLVQCIWDCYCLLAGPAGVPQFHGTWMAGVSIVESIWSCLIHLIRWFFKNHLGIGVK